jgi:uncharacterized membrane protein
MIEIIPNLHPVFVHFTVALVSIAVALFVILFLLKDRLPANLIEQWRTVARWNLWLGAAISLVTAAAGFYAYNTVAHDGPSHVAMTVHRNWAIATLLLIVAVALWSMLSVRAGKRLGALFVGAMLVVQAVLLSTAWHGGELVYRYGLGVMSLPQATGDGHDHQHADGHDHGGTDMSMEGMEMEDMEMPHDDGHDHQH